ncbi:unnamed protein product [Auanema sp. JU1783]|nr:unnamed protein product [Auanema sp. JU1783]
MAKGKNKNQPRSGATTSANRINAMAAKLESSLGDQLIKGRHPCKCQARIHGLIRNCLGCGKIVCIQEGSGPCFFCGTLVCTVEERQILERGSRASAELYKKLMGTDISGKELSLNSIGEDFQRAAEFRNKLLEADMDVERKTKVNDLQSDYSSLERSAFLSLEERTRIMQRRDELIELRNKQRRALVVNLDLENLTLEEKKHKDYAIDINNDPIIQNILEKSEERRRASDAMHASGLDVEWVPKTFVPQYDATKGSQITTNSSLLKNLNTKTLANSEIASFEVDNQGYVIVLQQPLATLVAHGVHKLFRFPIDVVVNGPVFIASDGHSATSDEIDSVIKKHFRERKKPEFPVFSILGRIFVEDCYTLKEHSISSSSKELPGKGEYVVSVGTEDPFVRSVEHISLTNFYQVDEQLRKILNSSYSV